MKVLIYAGSEFMTGDAIAHALMQCSQALAEGHNAATIEVPIVEKDGTRSIASFLVGPSSQIVAKDVQIDFEDPIDAAVVSQLEELTRGLHPSASVDSEPRQTVEWEWED